MRRFVLVDNEKSQIIGSVDELHTITRAYELEAIDTTNGDHWFWTLDQGWEKFNANIDGLDLSKYMR